MAPPTPILALQGVAVTFGGRPLFEEVDLPVSRGDRVCLVGRNGSGKSTLMKVLAGITAPDGGQRFIQPGVRVSYLPQEPDFGGATTVHDYVAQGLAADDRDESHRVDAVLDRLDLDGERDPTGLSGGEARRAALARTLVGDPDVMLLDEPTNHLDLPTIQWLEEHLSGFRGGLLLISHDRAFLSNLAKRTFWMDRGRLRLSERPFKEFEAWRDEVFAADALATHKMDRLLAKEGKWAVEGISARRTRNQGRLRALRALRQERSQRIAGGEKAKLVISEAEKGGRLVIEAKNLSKTYDTPDGRRTIVQDFSTRILRGDKVGFIGPNGAGKTTMLKMLIGQIEPDSGSVRHGTEMELAVFDQRRADLNPEDTLKQVLCPHGGDKVMVGGQPRHLSGYLQDFLFDTRQMNSPVKSLSGGERNRLILARLFARPSNLMILDEPTNDLDMDTLDLLEEVLGDYQGTLLLVSHDRDFLDRLVTSTIALEGDGSAVEYAGGYSDYLIQRPEPAEETAKAAPKATAAKPPPTKKAAAKLSYKDQRELDELPGRMGKLEKDIAKLETEMADPGLYTRDPDGFAKRTAKHEALVAELAASEERWLELEALRESLEGGAP